MTGREILGCAARGLSDLIAGFRCDARVLMI